MFVGSSYLMTDLRALQAMAGPVLPSKVVDRKFISNPPEEELVGNYGWEDCGKWILVSAEADLAFLDETWSDLQPLLEDGTLLMLKSSTALLKSETAVIQCFTRFGKEEAIRTARAIRTTVDFKGIMYYKMNNVTQAEVGRRHGHEHISTYMQTYLGRFYVRDSSTGDWILEENSHGNVSISSRFRRENYSGSQELPSTSKKRFMNLPRSRTGGANWNLKCSLSETNGAYLPEADRVCIVARELFTEGHFPGISWCKNDRGVEMRFYVTTSSSISSQLIVCDRILTAASARRVMYFTHGNESDIKYTYKYTAEGELYEKTEFAEKFVLKRE